MEIVLASRNKKKITEMQALLTELCNTEIKILSLDDIGYTGDIEEDGESFEENAVIKASVPAKMGYFGISDDSGLAVDYLDGAPGIYSARYSGEGATDEQNNEKLMAEMMGVEEIEENGTTFEENATIKAMAVWKPGRLAIADDSGLCVNALNGAPGIYSARYAGEPTNDENNKSVLTLLVELSMLHSIYLSI